LLSSSLVIRFGCGSGLTFFKYRHIAKPCPLAVMPGQQTKEMENFVRMFKNQFFNAKMTYIEILPVGLNVTLISSLI
jgi:hypothetical protein